MQEVSPESPEERRRHPEPRGRFEALIFPWKVVKRIAIGVYSDGFIHAGNLAYLALLTLFPFFIVMAAILQTFGRSEDGLLAVASFLRTLPRSVANLLREPIYQVLAARTGPLLWLGALVGLWTVGSFIETVRDILRRAYGTTYSYPFWRYRIWSVALIVGSVLIVMISFSAQVVLTGVEEFIYRLVPVAREVVGWIGLSKLVPGALMFLALYIVFYSLTPSKYRYSKCQKWPGALFVAVWWIGTTAVLPKVLGLLGGYDLTYGGLAGTIIALVFFWVIGLGLVIGAHLNAALAEPEEGGLKEPEAAVRTEG
ncbi:YihY/virulence factor BrkB family protein [Sphingomonas sp. ID0503]|uniref:YihY/virulence factor BrkB family protein n=1 Tax=Sphingomonas sp. ID0503 TaxID=3399691 RepID=UPI003AFA2AC9